MKQEAPQPLFSVLIANYNNGCFLEDALKSIYNQTYQNWEIIIVDDGSTDNSREIYQKYTEDRRIRVFYNTKNKGCGYTKRKCVEFAKGEICGFVDPDDAVTDVALEEMIQLHTANPQNSLVYSTHYICDSELNPLFEAYYVGPIPVGKFSWEQKLPVISHFCTFKKSFYDKTAGISANLPKAVDKNLYYILEETGPTLFYRKPLYFYRHHEKSISLNQNSWLAYKYHLVIKFDIISRAENINAVLNKMPHAKEEFAKALLIVGAKEIQQGLIVPGLNRIFRAVIYLPKSTMNSLIKGFSISKLIGLKN